MVHGKVEEKDGLVEDEVRVVLGQIPLPLPRRRSRRRRRHLQVCLTG
jgi:hypothetical protein